MNAQLLTYPSWLRTISEAEGRARLLAAVETPNAIADAACDLLQTMRWRGDLHEFADGSWRRVFAHESSGVVIKCPVGHPADEHNGYDGASRDRQTVHSAWSNIYEVRAHETASYCGPIASCRLVWHESGLPLVIMEQVTTLQSMLRDSDGPRRGGPDPRAQSAPKSWMYYVDGEQVGLSASGEWVVYDAGCTPCLMTVPTPEWWPRARLAAA